MKKTILIISFSFFIYNAFSQWKPLSSSVLTDIRQILFVDADTGFIISNRLILKSVNGGISWNNTLTSSSNSLFIDAINFPAHDIGFGLGHYAIGTQSTIFSTLDGGNTWIEKTMVGIKHSFYDIYFANSTTGYVVGDSGWILKTINQATSWTSLNSNTNTKLHSVHFINASIGVAVGGDNTHGIILRTDNGGVLWDSVDINLSNKLESVWFNSSGEGFAVGNNGDMLKTIDSGATWSFLPAFTNIDLHSVYFLNDSLGLTVGTIGDSSVIFKTENKGNNWVIDFATKGMELNDLYITGESSMYACGKAGKIITTKPFECKAYMSNYNYICASDNIILGSSPTAWAGKEPYSYNWVCVNAGSGGCDASEYLDNTTVSNPICSELTENTTLILTVIDSESNVCVDTVILNVSPFSNTDTNVVYINPYDSVQLYTNISGGYAPFSYLWTPSSGLNDPTDVNTYASPDSTTIYMLTITDSIGCSTSDYLVVNTDSMDVSIKKINFAFSDQINDVFPNPSQSGKFFIYIKNMPEYPLESIKLRVLDLRGVIVDETLWGNDFVKTGIHLDLSKVSPSFYIVELYILQTFITIPVIYQ